MTLSSPAFENGQSIPIKHGYKQANSSPPLAISQVPAQCLSLALLVHDPDAPVGDWVHWLVWNIPPDTAEIAEGSLPPAASEGVTDYGQANWGGPAPPSGTHRYIFELYALDDTLNLPITANRSDFERAVEGHIIETAELMGTYAAAP